MGEVDRRGGGARVRPSKKKGLDKNESLPRVKKKCNERKGTKTKKAKKKRRKKGGWKKKESRRNGKKQ